MTWKVGTARAKITPEKGLWVSGCGTRDHPVEGTLHDLWVKVLALEVSDGGRAVIVTSDLLGFPKAMYEAICAKLKKRCGLDRAQIMLTSSHTHTGPVLSGSAVPCHPLNEKQWALVDQYSFALEETVVATVAKALSETGPATLWAGEGATDFAGNRRTNKLYSSNWKNIQELLERGVPLKGPVDHSVPVLAVRMPEGRLRAVVFGHACHPVTLNCIFYQWSGDYAGFAQIALEQSHPDVLAMFYQGCGADQNPAVRRDTDVELCRKYGKMLAGAVEEVLQRPMRPIPPRLRTAFAFTNLHFGEQPTVAELQVLASKPKYPEHWSGRVARRRWAKQLLKMFDDGKKPFPKSYPYPVQVWKLGTDQLWISLGGEVVVDYSHLFRTRYGRETWVAAYANDVMCYIPSHRVWKERGYEEGAFTSWGGLPVKRWAPDLEERIAACVERLVENECKHPPYAEERSLRCK